ncbi:craniofacial development protein 2-like [Gordionus sp. m RMFG-2023]|uniref:craniofacial development protein 2-like n=1 Tax=Gordionus sp. m RMFG-2023 TaxID=3053472 RepID=UPI0031FD963C
MKDHNIKMISLNIRSLNDKLTILRQVMKDQHYDILFLQETHLKVTEVRNLLDYTLYCSSNAELVWAGVAIMIHNKLIRFVCFNPISSRICCLTLNLGYKKVHLFNIYALHNDSVFYMELENVLKELPHRDGIILAGDFNASVGKSKNSSCLGNATLIQSTNPNGNRLIEICELFNMKIGNTFFNHPTHHIMTYKSPSFGTTSQIDLFVISTKIFKWVRDIRVISKLNLTLFTDHYPLGCKLKINNSIFPNHTRQNSLTTVKYIARKDLAQLNDLVVKEEFVSKLTSWRNTVNGMINPNLTWKDIKLNLLGSITSCLRPRTKRREWLTPSTIQIIKNLTTNISHHQFARHHRRYITNRIRADRLFIANLSNSIQFNFDNNNIYKAFQSLKLLTTFKPILYQDYN